MVNYVLENNIYFNRNKYKNHPDFLVDNLFKIHKPFESYGAGAGAGDSLENDLFIVHDNYKCKLKEYNKKNFDPFCRYKRIDLIYEKKFKIINNKKMLCEEKSFETTVAQLNFFKWAIENHILDYIIEHFNDILSSMNETEKKNKQQKTDKMKQIMKNNSNPTTDDEAELSGNEKSDDDLSLPNQINLNKKTKKKEAEGGYMKVLTHVCVRCGVFSKRN